MKAWIPVTVAILCVCACHDVSKREREGYWASEGGNPSSASDGEAGQATSAGGAGSAAPSSTGNVTAAGGSAERDGVGGRGSGGADGRVIANGGGGDGHAGAAIRPEGPTSAGAGGDDDSPAPGGAGAGGEGGAPTSAACVPGAKCERPDDCWLGAVQCAGDVAVCVPARPAPEHTPCTFGECTGDGSCIKAVPSCADGDPTGCGVITIPGGSFRLGYLANDPAASAGEPVSVATFALDAYEVTVARFRKFWAARPAFVRDVTYPNGVHVRLDAAPHEPEPTTSHPSYNWSAEPALREHHPINRLTWQTAFLYCAWDGGRLPTEAEWEYAATGREVDGLVSGREFPWGDAAPDCNMSNNVTCGAGTSVPVDRFPAWGGLHQMAGNVTEWTADSFTYVPGPCWDGTPRENPLCIEEGSPFFTAKGGSYAGGTSQLRGSWRLKSQNGVGPRGVRCARDVLGTQPAR